MKAKYSIFKLLFKLLHSSFFSLKKIIYLAVLGLSCVTWGLPCPATLELQSMWAQNVAVSLHWKQRVLTTGPPRKSFLIFLIISLELIKYGYILLGSWHFHDFWHFCTSTVQGTLGHSNIPLRNYC